MKTELSSLYINTVLAGVVTLLVVGCNRAPEPAVTPMPSTTVGSEIDDSVVTTRVKSALLTDPDVKSFDLKVETRKGEVLLSGFVDNQTQIDRALAVTKAVEGVRGIENKLDLKGAATPVGVKLDDSVVTTMVKATILGDARVKSTDIAVITRKGQVQLSGFVDNQSQIDRAVMVTRGVEGVSGVSSELSIKK